MNNGRSHIVVTMHCVIVIMLLEGYGIFPSLAPLPHCNARFERMRFGNFIYGFQIATPMGHRENLPAAIRTHGFDGRVLGNFEPEDSAFSLNRGGVPSS